MTKNNKNFSYKDSVVNVFFLRYRVQYILHMNNIFVFNKIYILCYFGNMYICLYRITFVRDLIFSLKFTVS